MPTLRDLGGYLLDPMSAIGDFARYTTGDLLFPMERHLNSLNAQKNAPLQRAPLASLGQRYQDYPSDLQQNRPPQDIIRELFLQEMLNQQRQQAIPPGPPGTLPMRPGTPTWPYGYIRI